MQHDNDSGTIQGIYYFLVGTFVILFIVVMVVFPVVNGVLIGYNAYNAISTFPIMRIQQTTMGFFELMVNDAAPLAFIALFMSLIFVALRNKFGVN
jgi:hypothetical protein